MTIARCLRAHHEGLRQRVVDHGAALGIEVEIVERNPADKGFVSQARCWIVEQTYGTLMLFRRLVRDYELRPARSESRVFWAMTDIMSRRLTRAPPLVAVDMTRADTRRMDPSTWLLDKIDAREQVVTGQMEQTQAEIDALSAHLSELGEAVEHLRITALGRAIPPHSWFGGRGTCVAWTRSAQEIVPTPSWRTLRVNRAGPSAAAAFA